MTDEEAQGYIDQLRVGQQQREATFAAPTGSVTGSCGSIHVYAVAGRFTDDRVPDGWPCLCGQTVARWKTCDMGHKHLVSESPNEKVSQDAGRQEKD